MTVPSEEEVVLIAFAPAVGTGATGATVAAGDATGGFACEHPADRRKAHTARPRIRQMKYFTAITVFAGGCAAGGIIFGPYYKPCVIK